MYSKPFTHYSLNTEAKFSSKRTSIDLTRRDLQIIS